MLDKLNDNIIIASYNNYTLIDQNVYYDFYFRKTVGAKLWKIVRNY